MQIKVLLADDHNLVREGLKLILQAQADMTVVADVANGRDAVQAAQIHNPDVAILDITMPELNGLDAAQQIIESSSEARIIILSMHSQSEYVHRALKMGVKGYLLKDSAGNQLVSAIRSVYNGERFLCKKTTENMMDDYVVTRDADLINSPLEKLSSREREILQLVTEGKSSAEIGKRLFISPKTVDTYRSRLMQKLNINDIPTLVKFALQHGLTQLDR